MLIEFLVMVSVAVIYHGVLWSAKRVWGIESTHHSLFTMREQWLKQVRGKNSLLAVQTLRNWSMASTFLASTSILLTLGVLNVALGQFDGHWSDAIVTATPSAIKLLMLSALFLWAFLNFSLCLRSFNHAGYLAELTVGDEASDGAIAKTLHRIVHLGAMHYSFGMRAFYFCIPIIFWLFGAWGLYLGLILVWFFLIYLDYISG